MTSGLVSVLKYAALTGLGMVALGVIGALLVHYFYDKRPK